MQPSVAVPRSSAATKHSSHIAHDAAATAPKPVRVRRVASIAVSTKTVAGMKFLNDMANKYNASAIDCRNAFVTDDGDGRLSRRQTIGHEDFARVVIASVVSSIAGGDQVNLRIDEDGHIGSCVCGVETEYLNGLTLETDGRRTRLFDCRHWSVDSSVTTEDVEVLLEDMAAWLRVRQSSMDAGPPIADEQRYGSDTMTVRSDISNRSTIEYNRVSRACRANLETVKAHWEETSLYIDEAGIDGLQTDTTEGTSDVACHLQLEPSTEFPAVPLVDWLQQECETVVAPTDRQPPTDTPIPVRLGKFVWETLTVDKQGRSDWADTNDEKSQDVLYPASSVEGAAKPCASSDIRRSSATAGTVSQADDPSWGNYSRSSGEGTDGRVWSDTEWTDHLRWYYGDKAKVKENDGGKAKGKGKVKGDQQGKGKVKGIRPNIERFAPVAEYPAWYESPCPHCANIESWYDVLKSQLYCDDLSIMKLMNFSQTSPEAYFRSRSIIDKMLKAATDGEYKDSPSAFLTSNINNAWKDLNPSGAKYAGQRYQRWG